MLQILILAGVAVFLFWRLYLILGVRSGFENSINPKNIIEPQPSSDKKDDKMQEDNSDEDISNYIELESKSGLALQEMKSMEESFTVNNFISGAKAAYELILIAFDQGDLKVLEKYLAEEVFEDFKNVVVNRADKGLTVETEFIGVREIRLKNVVFDEKSKESEITVYFKSDVTSAVLDKDQNVVEGNRKKIKKQNHVWTFGRVMGSEDPTWKLVATEE